LERYQSDVEQCRRTFLNAKARQEKAYLLAGASKVRLYLYIDVRDIMRR
jgi:hypothetical protein